jgi:uncharacterized protein YjbK
LSEADQEIELKYVLGSRSDAEALRRELTPPEREILQQNVFFDTADRRLLAAQAAVRVRIEDPSDGERRALITFKGHDEVTGGLFSRREIEAEVPLEAALDAVGYRSLSHLAGLAGARDVMEAVRAAAGDLDPESIRSVGLFHNWRQVFRPEGLRGLRLELDETRIADEEFFEVEVELGDPGGARASREALEALLAGAGVVFRPGTESKYARMRRLGGGGGLTIIDY